MKYWVAIFNQATWEQFLQMPEKICAFTDPPTRRSPKLAVGDKIVCYVSKMQVWAGVLEVSGEPYRSVNKLYEGGVFPNRVPVKYEAALRIVDAVEMSDMEGKLSFFPKGATGRDWAPYVRTSPRGLSDPDGKALAEAIKHRKTALAAPSRKA